MKKTTFKNQFRAVINVNGKISVFSKSADSKDQLINLLNKHGMGVGNVVKIETFKILGEKQRGRTKSKY